MMRREKDPMAITRPIKIKRDFDGAKTVAKRLSRAPKSDSAVEQRLQALLAEMDRYEASVADNAGEGDDSDFADVPSAAPQRRWADEGRDN